MKKIFYPLTFLLIFSSSCFKQKIMQEAENRQITAFVNELGLHFDTLASGVLLHKTYEGTGDKFSDKETVKMIFDGYNLDKKAYFTKNDTTIFEVGSKEIFKGWNELAIYFAQGGSGIVIFPYNKAYKKTQIPGIPSNSTLVFYFQFFSDDYKVNQTSLFWKYTEKYDSVVKKLPNNLCYIKYFDGQGAKVDINNAQIDYSLRRLSDDSLITMSASFLLNYNSTKITKGLLQGVENMYEGEMGKIIIPPSLAYTETNIFNILPYTALYSETRVIASDPEKNQHSKISKYLYLKKQKPDSILPSGIHYFVTKAAQENATATSPNCTISYSDSLYIINHEFGITGCDGCNKQVNTTNFIQGILKAILLMKTGEEATFIIPYQEAYGETGFGTIPPYSTLLYKIKITDIK